MIYLFIFYIVFYFVYFVFYGLSHFIVSGTSASAARGAAGGGGCEIFFFFSIYFGFSYFQDRTSYHFFDIVKTHPDNSSWSRVL